MKSFQTFISEEKTQNITLTTSCLIRVMEYVREDVKDDSGLHKLIEQMAKCDGVIEMACFEKIVEDLK